MARQILFVGAIAPTGSRTRERQDVLREGGTQHRINPVAHQGRARAIALKGSRMEKRKIRGNSPIKTHLFLFQNSR